MADPVPELSPDTLVLHCVDLRRRLRQTEKSLQGLSALEQGISGTQPDQNEIRRLVQRSADASQATSPGTIPFLTMDDLSPRNLDPQVLEQGLNASQVTSSLGSLRALRTPAVLPSSTPKQYQGSQPRRYDLDVSNGSYRPDSISPSMVQEEILRLQEERRLFKEEIVLLRDENSQLLSRNQALVHDVENGKLDIKRLGEKLRLLSGELGKYRATFPDLEEKVISLTAETKAQDTALRNAEERCEQAQKELAEARVKLTRSQTEYDNSSKDMTEEKKLRKRLELQRDAAVEELNQLQGLLNVYQRKSKDKIASLEKREDRLQDDLSQANQEREELQEKSSLLQEQVYDLEEELRQLREQTGADEDTKADLETENCSLQTKLKELEQQIELFRCAVSEKADLEQENASLRSRVESQAEQLSRCQGEITDSRVMLEQLERLVEQVQTKSFTRTNSTNDSGVGSIDSARGRSAQLSLDGHSSRAPVDQSGVRKLLSMQERESHQLQANLQAMASYSQTTQKTSSIVENLRSELLTTVEKQKLCEQKSRELETLLCELEAERNRLRSEISEIRSDSSGRDAICLSLEARLKQRETQLEELQDEISVKSSTIHNMERELRKKSSQMTSLEEQLDEKVREFTMHVTRLKLQEDDVAAKMEEIQALRAELNHKDKQLREFTSAGETVKRVQQEQFQEFEKQIDMLQEELEKRIKQNVEVNSELQRSRAELEAKSTLLTRTESELTATKQELDEKREEERKSLAHLESQTSLATNQIKQLETALVVCREEMGTYVKQLDESKEQFEKTVNDKNKQISVLDRQLKEGYLEMEQKEQEISELGRSVREQQSMLTQGNRRVGELEDSQAQLQEQVSCLEQKLLQEKGQWLEESRSLERKLHSACVELETRASQMADLTEALGLVQEDKAMLGKELKSLDKELMEAQNNNDRIDQKLTQLEKENRDLRVMVEQKSEMVQDLEDQTRQQGETMERQKRKLEDRENQIEDVKAEVKLHKVRSAELRDQLQQSQFDCKAKEQMLEDLQEALRRGQEVVSENQERVRELEKALEDRLWELHQRASQVSKLENTMKDYQESVEQSAANQKAEMDRINTHLQDRSKQLSDVEDNLEVTQKQMREVTLQLEQAQQTTGRLENDLKNMVNEMTAKEEEIESSRRVEKAQKEDMAELTQELRLAREQLQQRHSEFSVLKQDLRETELERDKLSRDMERNTNNTQNATITLQREVDALREREKMLELRLSSETSRHEQEVERMSRLQNDEITKLQESYANVLATNEQLSAQSRLQQKTIEDRNRITEKDMMTAKALVEQLQEQIQAKNTLLESVHETVVLKDAEMARLQAKVSQFERDVGMRAAEQWMAQRDSITSSQYSDALIGQSSTTSNYVQSDGSGHWNTGVVQDQVNKSLFAQNNRIPLQGMQQSLNTDANSFRSEMRSTHCLNESEEMSKNPPLRTDRQNSSFSNNQRGLVPNSWQRRGCDSGKLFETSDTDSDRETCRRIAEISSESDQGNNRVPYQDTRARMLVSSLNSQDVARTLDFDESATENSNNSNIMSHIPVRDPGKPGINSQPQGNASVLPLKSAFKTSKECVKNVNFSSRLHQPTQQIARQNKSQIQPNSKLKNLAGSSRTSQQGGSIPQHGNKRQSANFDVYDLENAVTAVQQYQSPVGSKSSPDTSAVYPPISAITADEDAALSVEDLQERLRANKQKQEEIDRQLLSLESEFEVSQDVADISQ